jgi:acylphosphatase
MRVARRYLIRGRVQGVGFRYFTRDAALRQGIHGWVRNNPDRTVEVRAEAEADALERFEQEIRQGPPGARVESVELIVDTPGGRAEAFVIR